MSGLINKAKAVAEEVKHKATGDKGHTTTDATTGTHAGSSTHTGATGPSTGHTSGLTGTSTGHTGTSTGHTSGITGTSGSTNAGPHSSNMANTVCDHPVLSSGTCRNDG